MEDQETDLAEIEKEYDHSQETIPETEVSQIIDHSQETISEAEVSQTTDQTRHIHHQETETKDPEDTP